MIICAQADQGEKDSKWRLKEEQFGNNCDIFSIQPTLDEWAAWVAPESHPEVLKVVRAFIEKNGAKHEPYGFDLWQRTINSLHNFFASISFSDTYIFPMSFNCNKSIRYLLIMFIL